MKSISVLLLLLPAAGACSSSPSSADSPGPKLAIVAASSTTADAALHAVGGDALALKVVIQLADGTVQALPAGAHVVWNAPDPITALPPDSAEASPIPAPGSEPTAAWLSNPSRADQTSDLADVLFVLDPGTVQNASVQVSATVTGATPAGTVLATVDVDPAPAGEWTRGAALYGAGGANCAACHGATGHGSPEGADATSFTIAGKSYPFPAPGLNAEPGNAAGDPDWNAAIFAAGARADIDNGGIALRLPMPNWLTTPSPATGKPLSTQDFADIYAFLKTETH